MYCVCRAVQRNLLSVDNRKKITEKITENIYRKTNICCQTENKSNCSKKNIFKCARKLKKQKLCKCQSTFRTSLNFLFCFFFLLYF